MSIQQQSTNSLPLAAPPLSEVRWAFIGLGSRGTSHLGTVLQLQNARVTAICDTHEPNAQRGAGIVETATGQKPAFVGSGPDDWRRIIERDDVDAVVISNAWSQHAPMAIEAMNAGKHVFLEVPAATTLEDCWRLVDTSEATQKHCMMLENCNYGREQLMLLNMVRKGLFGDLLHGEGAYIHELRKQMFQVEHGTGSWRTYEYANHQGNLYSTHGVGPIAHCMDVNRGDYFDYMVSMSSPARGRQEFARQNFAPDHRWNQIQQWNCGDLNTSLIKLMSGKTIMVQWDETTPRPYSLLLLLQGTRATFSGFPNRIALDYPVEELPEAIRASTSHHDGRTNFHEWDTNMEPWFDTYDHPLWKKVGQIAEEHGGHGGMDYIMFWRVQQCLLNGKPLDQSVYDGALWSSIRPLSGASVESGSTPQKFPDFTRGKWKTTPRVEIEC